MNIPQVRCNAHSPFVTGHEIKKKTLSILPPKTKVNHGQLPLVEQLELLFKADKQAAIPRAFQLLDHHSDSEIDILLKILQRTIQYTQRDATHEIYHRLKPIITKTTFKKILILHQSTKDIYGMIELYKYFNATKFVDLEAYEIIIQTWAQQNSGIGSLQLLMCLLGLNITPNQKTFQTVLKSLIKSKNYQEALKLTRTHQIETLFANIWTRNEFRYRKDLDLFLTVVYNKLDVLDLSLDDKRLMCLAILDGFRRRKQHFKVIEVHAFIKKHDIKVCSELGSALCAGYIELGDSGREKELLGSLREYQKPYPSMYIRIIQAYLNIDQFDKAVEFYDKMTQGTEKHSSFIPEPCIGHIFLVYFISKNNFDKGIEFYQQYLKDGGYPNQRVYEVLIELCIGRKDEMNHYWQELLKLESNTKDTLFIESLPPLDIEIITPKLYSHKALHYLKLGEVDSLNEVIKKQSILHRDVYLNIAKLFYKSGDYSKVENIIQSMLLTGYTHCPRSFCLYINSCKKRFGFNDIEKTLMTMYQDRIKLTRFCWEDLINCYSEANQFKKAFKLINEMEKEGFGVSTLKYNIKEKLRQSNFDHMFDKARKSERLDKWFKDLKGDGFDNCNSENDDIHELVLSRILN
jgi:pentatricopeptide repeat protein